MYDGKYEVLSLYEGGMSSGMCALVEKQKDILNLKWFCYKNIFHHYKHTCVLNLIT